jgi:type II secretory pathway pseudopilin PulG
MSKVTTIRKAEGFALLDLIFVCGIIGLILSIAVPRLLQAKQSAGAAAAIGTLRTVASAELTFALTCGSGFYAPTLRVLGTAPPGSNEPFVGGDMGAAVIVQRSGYTFRVDAAPYPGAPSTCNGLGPGESGQGYAAAADPTDATNVRFFGTNSNAQLWEHNATLWSDMPELGEPPFGSPLR